MEVVKPYCNEEVEEREFPGIACLTHLIQSRLNKRRSSRLFGRCFCVGNFTLDANSGSWDRDFTLTLGNNGIEVLW